MLHCVQFNHEHFSISFRNILTPFSSTHFWPSVVSSASLSSHQWQEGVGNSNTKLLVRVPGSRFSPYEVLGCPSLFSFCMETQGFLATKGCSHPPLTHTFGIVSYTGVNHIDDLDELDSCDCLHNVWYASSSAFLLCYFTALERMSGFYSFFPFSLFTWSY